MLWCPCTWACSWYLMEMSQRLLLGFQQANQKQWGSYISTAQVFLHDNVTFLPMFHLDIKVGDLEVCTLLSKNLYIRKNISFFFHFKYYFQPPMNHVNSQKSHILVQRWWNLSAIGQCLQIDPFIKGNGELYLQDHRHVYVFCMFLVSQGTSP